MKVNHAETPGVNNTAVLEVLNNKKFVMSENIKSKIVLTADC